MQESDPDHSQYNLQQGASHTPSHQSDPQSANGLPELANDPVTMQDRGAAPAMKPDARDTDGYVRLAQVVAMNGQKLTRAVASLTKRHGKRPVYAESTPEELTKLVGELVDDPKGAIRLRTILGLGLQQGAKRPATDAFWGEFLKLVDNYLRILAFPRTIAADNGTTPLEPLAYRDLWHTIILPNYKNVTKGSKELLAAQEVILLDIMFAHWKGRLSSNSFLGAISYLELPEDSKDPWHRRLPWNTATSLATDLPALVIVAQAGAVHGALEHAQCARREATQRINQLEENLKTTFLELEQTQAALYEESSRLRSASEAIEQLRRDVQAAGAIHRHRADELRSRYRGLLGGELNRHLENILRAAGMTPPRGSVIIERVETLLETLNRELLWLENSE